MNFVSVIQIPTLKEVSKLRLQIGKRFTGDHEDLNELNRSIDLGFCDIRKKIHKKVVGLQTQQLACKPLKQSLKLPLRVAFQVSIHPFHMTWHQLLTLLL